RARGWAVAALEGVSSPAMSGEPSGSKGVGSPEEWPQCPAVAALLAGGCPSALSPWKSPTRAWIGATISAIHMAIESILRIAGLSRPRNRCQAAEAPTMKAVARNAAIAMWVRRYGKDGLKITANQSTGTTMPLMISWPWGVCIQLLDARIQKVEISVPIATMTVAKKCRPGPTRFQPNSITPRKPASRKNAVSTSYASKGPVTLPANSEKALQL